MQQTGDACLVSNSQSPRGPGGMTAHDLGCSHRWLGMEEARKRMVTEQNRHEMHKSYKNEYRENCFLGLIYKSYHMHYSDINDGKQFNLEQSF